MAALADSGVVERIPDPGTRSSAAARAASTAVRTSASDRSSGTTMPGSTTSSSNASIGSTKLWSMPSLLFRKLSLPSSTHGVGGLFRRFVHSERYIGGGPHTFVRGANGHLRTRLRYRRALRRTPGSWTEIGLGRRAGVIVRRCWRAGPGVDAQGPRPGLRGAVVAGPPAGVAGGRRGHGRRVRVAVARPGRWSDLAGAVAGGDGAAVLPVAVPAGSGWSAGGAGVVGGRGADCWNRRPAG